MAKSRHFMHAEDGLDLINNSIEECKMDSRIYDTLNNILFS